MQSGDGAPVIVIHSREQATAALTAAAQTGRRIVLASGSDAGGHVGPGWFRELVAAARDAVPQARFSALLDCGDDVGAALAAIRSHVDGIIFTGRADVAGRLEEIARQHEVRVETIRAVQALDLGEDFFASRNSLESRCTAYLS
ncbi:MAG: hypothetical protein J2P48_08800 [Alphaproteobacteria bacterium]|nr:hypothetical protein [Alphaproteobacteria bacterium]